MSLERDDIWVVVVYSVAVGVVSLAVPIAVQALGAGVAAAWAFGIGWLVYKALDATMGLRASTEHEQRGLDYTEHYEIGYGEFMAARTHRDLGGEG